MHALGESKAPAPACPFQADGPPCAKKGGVCSMRQYAQRMEGRLADRLGAPVGAPVVMCPKRFEQNNVLVEWLAEIVGFDEVFVAREVPFMVAPDTGRPAGRIDLVLASDRQASAWYALEMQAVYFSGPAMAAEFAILRRDGGALPPAPTATRRPDWRSSSAKRLMPQLETKTPTLRQWGKKMAVAVDFSFFAALGGSGAEPSRDLNEGDILWLVPEIRENYALERRHWEVLSMEASSSKLLSANRVKRGEFETALAARLRRSSTRSR